MTNFHPITVHFTIALLYMAVLFDLLGWVAKKESLVHAGWWCLVFALPASLASLFSGLYAEDFIYQDDVIHELVERHESLGFVVVGVVVVLLLWRVLKQGQLYEKARLAYTVIGIVGVLAISAGGWIGGEMVYKYGAGVQKRAMVPIIKNDSDKVRMLVPEEAYELYKEDED